MSHDHALNAALGFFHAQLKANRVWGKIGFVGKWQATWKEDVLTGTEVNEAGKYHAILSLYKSLYKDALGTLDYPGLYLEATKDNAQDARKRIVDAGFSDVTIHADEHQRYIIARKAGR